MKSSNFRLADVVRMVRYGNFAPVVILNYWVAAGDAVLGVASVLLLLGALVPDVELLVVLLFGEPAFMPLSELAAPGMP